MLQYIPLVGGLLEKWMSGRQQAKSQTHTEQMAVYEQFASEFRDLTHRTWWDSLVDGINRLPRPMITFGVIYLFYYAVTDPEGFERAALAITAVPYEMWVALWMVLGFWFGTKAIEKMPKAFGKNPASNLISNTGLRKKILPDVAEPEKDEHNEGIEWNERVEKRYKHEDNSTYNQ